MSILEEKIKSWSSIKAELDKLKKLEATMRVELCEELINGKAGRPLLGKATKKEVFDDFIIKADAKTALKVDEEIWDALITSECLSKEEIDCVKYKPDVSKTNLKKVSDKSRVYEALDEKPAMPTLVIKWTED